MANQLTSPMRRRSESGFAERFMGPLTRMRSGVDHLFDDFPVNLSAFQFGNAPAVEMTEAADCYKIAVELPGIPLEDIDLEVDRDALVVKGEKKEERKDTDGDYVISERSYGAFTRRIALPSDALTDEIDAKAVDGVLRISIPRNADAASKRRRIEIHTGGNGA